MHTHAELKRKMLSRPKVRVAYEALAEEFAALDELLNARIKAGLTQAQVAERMGTKAPAIARLEASLAEAAIHRRWRPCASTRPQLAGSWRFGSFRRISDTGRGDPSLRSG